MLLRSGDKVGDNVYGLLVDKDGKGLELEGEPYISSGNGALRCSCRTQLGWCRCDKRALILPPSPHRRPCRRQALQP